MFELAAFMKSRSQPNTDDVVIRPTLLGGLLGGKGTSWQQVYTHPPGTIIYLHTWAVLQ